MSQRQPQQQQQQQELGQIKRKQEQVIQEPSETIIENNQVDNISSISSYSYFLLIIIE